ncbi:MULTISPECIES: hypothetical protein [Francisella]|uniref:Uncharacterized protein n=1 Tax=Francisella opportunistica TaxID=2016517 RepID=A0A345JSZ2_9GAMM|nr:MULTISPECIES: hypothetical protein [Francisella]AXH30438.1 hypothetical protein CGC43_07525 [Francisella opportunistica]AXH32079.1 hypothetical protein CGC44_07500 [Francisella opportunistica]AXH33726.1 hypothetical protein CGC45_07530 [Francisella opportunistica]
MSISSIINVSLYLDKFFLSKKEKKRRKLEVINTLNEASNLIQEILDLEENIEEMAHILESNYKKANDSLDKAKDLIRVYFSKRKANKTKEMYLRLSKLKIEIAYIRDNNYETEFIQGYMSELITALTNFIYAKDNYINQYF